MTIVDISKTPGRRYPAGRRTRNLVGGASVIQHSHFCQGYVELEPGGGQVPWHNHPEEETYFIIEGDGQICIGDACQDIHAGQCVFIPSMMFHQLTNTGAVLMKMMYTYGPSGDVAHWRQELEGTLPVAGVDAPPLPTGAFPQHTAVTPRFPA
jgi:mannose-6-phosphate isomerase-like protein (cupin superfamily)